MDDSPAPAPLGLGYYAPYLPPVAARYGVWREGHDLMMFGGSALPRACLKCGARRCHSFSIRFFWLPGHLRLFAGFLFVALGFAQKVKLEVHLCPACLQRRRQFFRLAGLLAIGGATALVLAICFKSTNLAAESLILSLVAIWLGRRACPVRVRHVGRGLVRLSGAAGAYLAPLPIGGPPGVGITSTELADRVAHLEDEERARRKRRKRRRRQRRRHKTDLSAPQL